jgi:hypothetical protein
VPRASVCEQRTCARDEERAVWCSGMDCVSTVCCSPPPDFRCRIERGSSGVRCVSAVGSRRQPCEHRPSSRSLHTQLGEKQCLDTHACRTHTPHRRAMCCACAARFDDVAGGWRGRQRAIRQSCTRHHHPNDTQRSLHTVHKHTHTHTHVTPTAAGGPCPRVTTATHRHQVSWPAPCAATPRDTQRRA